MAANAKTLLVAGECALGVAGGELRIAEIGQAERDVPVPRHLVRIGREHGAGEPEHFRVGGQSAILVAGRELEVADLQKILFDVELPLDRVGLGQRLADCQGFLESGKPTAIVAVSALGEAQLDQGGGKIPAQIVIAGISIGELPCDLDIFSKRRNRAFVVTSLALYVADALQDIGFVGQQFRVVGVRLDDATANRKTVLVAGDCPGGVAGGVLHVTDAAEDDREIALPGDIVRIGLSKLALNVGALFLCRERLLVIATRRLRIANATQICGDVPLQPCVVRSFRQQRPPQCDTLVEVSDRTDIVAAREFRIAALALAWWCRTGRCTGSRSSGASTAAGSRRCGSPTASRGWSASWTSAGSVWSRTGRPAGVGSLTR